MENFDTEWLLKQWAIWARQGGCLPSAGKSPMFRDVPSKVTRNLLLITEDEALRIDSIIAKLKGRDREMAKALVIYYFSGGNTSHVARVLSAKSGETISRKRVDVLVTSATAWVDAVLFVEQVA